MKIQESTVIEFLNRNVTEQLFTEAIYGNFLALIEEKKEIAAAEEYCKITNASIEEAHLAATIAQAQNENS